MKLDDMFTRALGCRSDFELGGFIGKIEIDGIKGLTQLDAESLRAGSTDADAKAKRGEIIEAVRGGKHVELAVSALTFRQKKGASNRRYLRLGGDVAARAKTFAKLPFLVDHDTGTQASRKGTILSSKMIEESSTAFAFEMAFNVVKPDAVISVLDGTIDAFSIGWFSIGPVMCSAHDVDVRGADCCYCWPGQTVLVDGKPKIVEYVFTDWEGKELSGVNVPAVKHTAISDIHAALSAELNIPSTRNKENKKMLRFQRLAAALQLTALEDADEDRALAAVAALAARANRLEVVQTELAAARTDLTQATAALKLATAAGVKIRVDAMLDGAYRGGKLKLGRDDAGKAIPSKIEVRLRKIAERDGVEALEAELAEMEVVVPVGQRLQASTAGAPERTELGAPADGEANPFINNVAAQLGIKPEDMAAFAKNHVTNGAE